MRLWKLRLNSIVISRVVESESPESHIVERNRNSFFRFDKIEVVSRRCMFRFGGVGNRSPYCFWRLCFTLNYFTFYLCLYRLHLPESQESAAGAIRRESNYPDLLPEMPRYCCPVEIFILVFSFIKIRLKFRSDCHRQAGESAVEVFFLRTQ